MKRLADISIDADEQDFVVRVRPGPALRELIASFFKPTVSAQPMKGIDDESLRARVDALSPKPAPAINDGGTLLSPAARVLGPIPIKPGSGGDLSKIPKVKPPIDTSERDKLDREIAAAYLEGTGIVALKQRFECSQKRIEQALQRTNTARRTGAETRMMQADIRAGAVTPYTPKAKPIAVLG